LISDDRKTSFYRCVHFKGITWLYFEYNFLDFR
jgi:hypothetical protein